MMAEHLFYDKMFSIMSQIIPTFVKTKTSMI